MPRGPIVLLGPNGSGKTNILEALSLLSPGRGMRRAPLKDIQCHWNQETPWRIEVLFENETGGPLKILTNRFNFSEKRHVRINESAKSQAFLVDYVKIAWLTPSMDRFFVETPGVRRRFLDRLVFNLEKIHSNRILGYEKAWRQRIQLLEGPFPDTRWVMALEQIISKEGAAITRARLRVLEAFNHLSQETCGSLPKPKLFLKGKLESMSGEKPDELEGVFLQHLEKSRKNIFPLGGDVGCHRSNLEVFHPKGWPAHLCSTGEQKALLIALVLTAFALQTIEGEGVSILLLDEAVAHLDGKKRQELFDHLVALKRYVWLTGTDKFLFKGLEDNASFFSLTEPSNTL